MIQVATADKVILDQTTVVAGINIGVEVQIFADEVVIQREA